MKTNRELSNRELPTENPIPGEFSVALMLGYGCTDEKQLECLQKPFTTAWEPTWIKVSKSKNKGIFIDLSSRGEISELFPGASEQYRHFKENVGFYSLETLADRGADPNFILSVFVKYLWNEEISSQEHKDYSIKDWQNRLAAIKLTKEHYLQFYKKSLPMLLNAKNPDHPAINLYMDTFGGEARGDVERFLCEAEEKITHWLDRRDFRDPNQRRPPDDKVNRTIFTIYLHLKQRTGGPQWETFWDLLVRAGAIKGKGVLNSKNGQIKAHIESFRKDHLKECLVMPDYIKNWPIPDLHLHYPLP